MGIECMVIMLTAPFRDMVSGFFTDDYVEQLVPFIQETVQRYLGELIEAHKGKKAVDLVKYFALPIPSKVHDVQN